MSVQYNSQNEEASEQREAEPLDETIIAINEKTNEFNFIIGFLIGFLIINILTFSIKCHKKIDNEQKKLRHCDDVKCSETNNNGKVSKEEFTNLISKFITGAPMEDRYGCNCWTRKIFRIRHLKNK